MKRANVSLGIVHWLGRAAVGGMICGCLHTGQVGRSHAPHTVVMGSGAEFWDYLPDSPAPKKGRCLLEAGSFGALAPPGTVGTGELAFVNFSETPSGCAFRQGFVRTAMILGGHPHPLGESAEGATGFNPSELEPSSAGDRLASLYTTRSIYDAVEKNVLTWYGERHEGCVAFASTALRFTGVPIPSDALIESDSVSIVTRPFVRYMLDNLRYQKIDDLDDARPGDIGVTAPDPAFPDYPTHVYVFAGWHSREELLALVVDNQGFMHPRPLRKSGDPQFADKDPTAYFIRPL